MNTLSETYIEWETSLTEFIVDKLGCTYGDAAGIVEANEEFVREGYEAGTSTEAMADTIVNMFDRL